MSEERKMDPASNRERQAGNPWLIEEVEQLVEEALRRAGCEVCCNCDADVQHYAKRMLRALIEERLLSLTPVARP